jgi:acyl carrier protein
MGLDTINLVIAIEKEFGIEISHADAAKLSVLGDMQDYIVKARRQRGETPNESRIWRRLTAVVVEQLGVRPEEVTQSADIVKDLRAD